MSLRTCVFLCLVLCAGSATAIPISLNYTGSYVGFGDTEGLFTPGDAVSGSFFYDSETLAPFPNPDFGVYDGGISAAHVSVGGQTFGLGESPMLPDDLSFVSTNQIFVSNNGGSSPDAPVDLLWFIAQIEQSILDVPMFSLLILQDFDAMAFETSTLPTTLPSLNEFESISVGLAVLEPFDEGGVFFNIKYDFALDNLTVGPVANVFEPASIILLLIGIGLILSRRWQRVFYFKYRM